ncbi:GL26942 [Drosophila persimilis]|uniref:GL26942 n=1 Tax=Drosophila persimilis TaxID=7234 RepID=B4HBF5_DROPE|nr:GL26942 [Drosophila persimilis]
MPSPRSCLLAVSLEDTIQRMVEDYFDVENFGVKPAPPVAGSDDERAQKILEDTTVRLGQRYQTGLLWKDNHIVLPRSFDMAYKRLVNVEKKMKRNGSFAQEYTRIIKDYVSKGYARRLERNEVPVESNRLWYLPHFGVKNPNKPAVLFHFREGAQRAKTLVQLLTIKINLSIINKHICKREWARWPIEGAARISNSSNNSSRVTADEHHQQ